MPNLELLNFIKSQNLANVSEEELKNKLIAVGWSEKDITEALAFKDLPMPSASTAPSPAPAKPVLGPVNTMFYAFQHILMFLTMAVYTFSLNSLFHVFIDRFIAPPPSMESGSIYNALSYLTGSDIYVRGLVSAIIVSYPLFMFLFLRTTKQRIDQPDLKYLASRAVLTYITLVITFLVMLFNVIKVIFIVLAGEITVAMFLHFLSPVVICGIIFWYFLHEILERRHRA